MATSEAGKKIHVESQSTVQEQFNLFSVPPSRTSIIRGEWEEALPVGDIKREGDIEFNISSNNSYLDLASTYLEMTVQVVKTDGSDLDAGGDCKVWPGDNFAHSLFDKCTVRLGKTDVEYTSNYGDRALIENLLNYGLDVKKSTLPVSSGWFEDAHRGNDVAQGGAGIVSRKAMVAESKLMSFYTRLRLSTFGQGRYVYPLIGLGVKLTRASVSKCLMAADGAPAGGARVLITEAKLHVRKVQSNSSLFSAQSERLLNGDRLKYPLRRVRVQTIGINKGLTLANLELERNSHRPDRLIVGLVRADAASGSFALNAHKFQPFGLEDIELYVEGMGAGQSFKPNFTTGENLAHPYAHLASLVESFQTGRPFSLTMDQWKSNSTLFGFHLAPDLLNDGGVSLIREGTIRLKFKFRVALPHNVQVIAYEEFGELLEVDLARNVHMRSSVL